MSLRNVMKKAAGLLVEMPPEDPAPDSPGLDSPPAASGPGNNPQEPDIDELLAVVRGPKAAAGSSGAGSPGVTGGTTNSPKPTGAPASASTATAAQIAQAGKGPNLDQIKSAAANSVNPGAVVPGAQASGPSVGTDGKLKVLVVYEAAGVPPTPFTAEQALELIQAMPKELPLEVKRRTVKATLSAIGKTLGANPQTIVADATRKAAALDAYLESFSKKSDEFVGKVEGEIKLLEAQIAEKRKAMETAKKRVEDLSKFCDQEADRLDDVLEFFSLDVGPSKYATENATATPGVTKEPGKS